MIGTVLLELRAIKAGPGVPFCLMRKRYAWSLGPMEPVLKRACVPQMENFVQPLDGRDTSDEVDLSSHGRSGTFESHAH